MNWKTDKEIYRAIRMLFGLHFPNSSCFLRSLTPATLKAVYRRRAFQNHPDRASIILQPADKLNERFKEISAAYHVLSSAVAHLKGGGPRIPENGFSSTTDPSDGESKLRNCPGRHYFKGVFPRRPLLLGQFLYHSGVASWQDLIDAIVWQRKQRPRIGEIALGWRMMSCADIAMTLASRRRGEKFGECGQRLGFLSQFQLMALIGRQRMLQKPLGRHFTEKGQLSNRTVSEMERRKRIHNRMFGRGL